MWENLKSISKIVVLMWRIPKTRIFFEMSIVVSKNKFRDTWKCTNTRERSVEARGYGKKSETESEYFIRIIIRISDSDVLPEEFSCFTIWFVFCRKSNALSLNRCLTNAVIFNIQIDPESIFILPWSRDTQNMRQFWT